jgi:hypothetical protein
LEPTGKAIGGYARAEALTPERRTEIARQAAEARWGKPPAPAPDLEDGFEVVKRCLTRTKIKHLNASEKKLLQAALAGVMLNEQAVDVVVGDFAMWAKESGATVRALVSAHWLRCLKESLDTDTPPPPIYTPPIVLEPQPGKSARLPAEWVPKPPLYLHENGLPDLAVKWNETVTSGAPVMAFQSQGATVRDLQQKLAIPQFVENIPKLLEKCQAICSKDKDSAGWCTFPWLIKDDNWTKVLNGRYDWVINKKATKTREEAVAAALAAHHEGEKKVWKLDRG